MTDRAVIAWTFYRETLETEVCTEREIQAAKWGVTTLMINVDAYAGALPPRVLS